MANGASGCGGPKLIWPCIKIEFAYLRVQPLELTCKKITNKLINKLKIEVHLVIVCLQLLVLSQLSQCLSIA